LVWTFNSIDPATGLPPEDPDAGFLPPNHTSPEGEGSVAYTIRPRTGIADGTIASNGASIVFDGQAALATGQWTNLLDRTSPTLTALQAEAGTDSTVMLRWRGSDQTSGVWFCDLYLIGASGRPQLAAAGLTVDSVRVRVRPESDMGFIAIVRDSANNRRAMPMSADAMLHWTSAPAPPTGVSGLRTYPSPARASFSAHFQLGERSDVDFGLFDVAGRRVWGRSAPLQEPGWQVHVLTPERSVRPGIYWLRVSTSRGQIQKRVVLLK
jgi:hypothetical protein